MLFRPEALEAQRQSALGLVQVMRPLSLSLLTTGVVLAVLAVGSFLWLAEYTRKASTVGVLVPDRGLIRLVPAMAGTVVESRVREGQTVAAGDVLFVLAQERALLEDGAQAQVQRSLDARRRSLEESARQQQILLKSQRAALDRRLLALQAEVAQLDAEARLQAQRLALAQQALARLEALQTQQFISPAQVQTKQEDVLGLQAAAQALARQRVALQREQAELDGERSALPSLLAGTAGEIERDLSLLEREAAEFDSVRRTVVRAPQAGTISAVLAEPGQSVGPGSALASLVPEGAVLQAHLYAPSSAIGFVRADQPVRLRFEAFPYQKYGHWPGHVLQVSRVPLAANELAGLALTALPAQLAGGEPMFRITVALDERSTPAGQGLAPGALSAGMRLQADVQLERRRLVEWLFEPLLGWRQRG
jgi:membrane fusion protein